VNVSHCPKPFELILDRKSLIWPGLNAFASQSFESFDQLSLPSHSILVVSRITIIEHREAILELANTNPRCVVMFDGAAEGSLTLMEQIKSYDLETAVLDKKILVISGGDMLYTYPHMTYDYFISVFVGYQENRDQMLLCDKIYNEQPKPYDFLFLNGRARPHRKYLWHQLNEKCLLNRALWTMLDPKPLSNTRLELWHNGQDLMRLKTPRQCLPTRYEVEKYRQVQFSTDSQQQNIKPLMFENTWGDVYLQAEPYIDTYFSLITETVADRPWSFRTEKIVKPIAAGHPWICASGPGFYKDLRNLGFKTFDHAIDESFDSIDNQQDRLDRIVDIVEDLCSQDLDSFLKSCYSVCKYNQQHLLELAADIEQQLPQQFFDFIRPYCDIRLSL
jgi:hypothetical protein